MPFQSTVNFDYALGLVGELAYDGPKRAEPGILNSADAANNVIGRVFTMLSSNPNVWRAGNPDNATNVRFGVLFSPKEYASYGTAAAGSLAPTITLPNNTMAAFLTMGEVWVTSVLAAPEGYEAIFAQATGIITSQAPGATPGAGAQRLPTGVFSRNPGNANGLVVLRLTA